MQAFRFLFMADCQLGMYASLSGLQETDVAAYADRGMTVQVVPTASGIAWDVDRYARAIAAANLLRPDFVVLGGDMVDDASSASQYEALVRTTAELDGIPMWWVPGNHDIAFDSLVPTTASIDAYRGRFGPEHYSFEHRGHTFVVVNTTVWDHPEEVPHAWDAELSFLEDELREAHRRGGHIVVFGHHPPFIDHPDEPDTYWNIPMTRRRAVLDLLHGFGAQHVFCGHWHRNGGSRSGDLEVVVSGPVGYPLGSDPSGYRIVEIDADEIRHRYVALDGTPMTS